MEQYLDKTQFVEDLYLYIVCTQWDDGWNAKILTQYTIARSEAEARGLVMETQEEYAKSNKLKECNIMQIPVSYRLAGIKNK